MEKWSMDDFRKEAQAWDSHLIKCDDISPLLSLEFSSWKFRKDFLVRRFDSYLEVHIVWSSNYKCPLLLVKISDNIPSLGTGFVGGYEYHPVLDQVFYAVHACETLEWMQHLDSNLPTGAKLLCWWSLLANRALNLSMNPEIFLAAMKKLRTSD